MYRGVISQSDRSQITWTTGANYPPGARSRIYAAQWGEKGIIVAGGASSGFVATNECYVYSPGANTWTAQANLPAVLLAYHSGSVRSTSGIWKFVVSGGVTNNPTALTGNTYIFTDTLSAPPPAGSDSTLVLFHDTTIVTDLAKRMADRDSVMKYLPGLISKYKVGYFNQRTATLPLANYKTIILVETSYDSSGYIRLSTGAKTDLKNWLSSGTSGNKKALISIGGDQAYNYDRGGSTGFDTVLTRTYLGYKYTVDAGIGAPGTITGVLADIGVTRTMDAPPSGIGGYYPDGVSLINGGLAAVKYAGTSLVDSLAAVSRNTTGYFVTTHFQDPRYLTGGNVKGWLQAIIAYAKTNGGTITNTTPLVSSVADKYSLAQNYPNPFNPTTKINFAIPSNGFVSLKVYDIAGKEVMTLVNKNMTVGSYAVDFNGAFLSSGVYFYRLEAGSFTETKKMMLVK